MTIYLCTYIFAINIRVSYKTFVEYGNLSMSTPRYREIAIALRSRIVKGEYPVGSLLPTEQELCDLYSASRHTIREAIKCLLEDGLVSRKKRVGTRVESLGRNYSQTLISIGDLVNFAERHLRQVLAMAPVTLSITMGETFEAKPGSEWLGFDTLRLEQKRESTYPVCWTKILLAPGYRDIAPLITQQPRTLVSELIEQHYHQPTLHISQRVDVTTLDERVAALLEVRPGTAALEVLRHYRGLQGQNLLITRTLSTPGKLALRSQLRNSGSE